MCCWLWTLCHTIQHIAVMIIFPLNLQTINWPISSDRYALIMIISSGLGYLSFVGSEFSHIIPTIRRRILATVLQLHMCKTLPTDLPTYSKCPSFRPQLCWCLWTWSSRRKRSSFVRQTKLTRTGGRCRLPSPLHRSRHSSSSTASYSCCAVPPRGSVTS